MFLFYSLGSATERLHMITDIRKKLASHAIDSFDDIVATVDF